jgi:hypothetical protein
VTVVSAACYMMRARVEEAVALSTAPTGSTSAMLVFYTAKFLKLFFLLTFKPKRREELCRRIDSSNAELSNEKQVSF